MELTSDHSTYLFFALRTLSAFCRSRLWTRMCWRWSRIFWHSAEDTWRTTDGSGWVAVSSNVNPVWGNVIKMFWRETVKFPNILSCRFKVRILIYSCHFPIYCFQLIIGTNADLQNSNTKSEYVVQTLFQIDPNPHVALAIPSHTFTLLLCKE